MPFRKVLEINFALWGMIACLFLSCSQAKAQSTVRPQFYDAGGQLQYISPGNPLPVSASVSASISGFAPVTTGTPISVTTSGDTGTLPAGAVVAAFNVGTTNTAYCKLGASSSTANIAIPPASWFAFTVGAATQLTCITSTSTTTVNMVGGSGLPTGAGGGGGGSGGGGAVTLASGAVSSGAYSSGSIASGAFASGSVGSGAFASGAIGSGALASGSFASGAVGSGAVASGAIASGAVASGSIASGAMVDLLTMRGTKNAGTAAANSLLAGSVYNSTPLTLTDTQQASLQSDSSGYLKVNVAAGGASGGTSSNFGSAFPTPGTAVGFSDGTNMVAAKVGAVANVTAATNMLNVLGAAQYNATPLTVTDTRYQSLQSDVNGFLKVNVAAGTNSNIAPSDGASNPTTTSPVISFGQVWNGSTWDRMPGSTAGVKTASLPYPIGSTPYTATATGTTGATTATLAGASSVTTYICGFSIRANATAAATGNATVTGVISATMNFTQWTAPNASGLGVTEMIFSPCVPASGTNQSIAVVSAAPGTGGVVSVTAWGYKL